MESLLPYYERELTYLRRLSHEFAERYPRVASRLLLSGEACDDPHIERLIESFAFLAARIHKRIDDDFPEFSDALLGVVYPQFLRPFPSASIAQFIAGPGSAPSGQAEYIAKGTMLRTRASKDGSCKFRTAYGVELLPLQIARADHVRSADLRGLPAETVRAVQSCVRLAFTSLVDGAPVKPPDTRPMRLYLHGEPSLVAAIREALLSRTVALWIELPGCAAKQALPIDAIRLVGFGEDDNLLDHDACVHDACRLILEYFAFPEKFSFIDIDFRPLAVRPDAIGGEFVLTIGLRAETNASQHAELLDRIGRDNFMLGCTPVLNLFRHAAEPVRISERMSAYPIVADATRPHAIDIYDIYRVSSMQQTASGMQCVTLPPVFSPGHADREGEAACYWHASRMSQPGQGRQTPAISFIDAAFDPRLPAGKTVSIELDCTNGDLPSRLPVNLPDGDLFLDSGSGVQRIRLLRKPTPVRRFANGRGGQWRFISHLTLNHLSLADDGAKALKEMLRIYDIARLPANEKQIGGIVSIEQRPAVARMQGRFFPAVVRGIEIRITVDESHYVGTGLHLFAEVLDRFFGHYVSVNSFTRLTVLSKHSGMELIRCQARNGNMVLA